MAKMIVAVHKASITMLKGETLDQFTNAIGDAGREHVFKKLNLSRDSGSAWMAETFGASVVFRAYKKEGPASYHAFTYKRDEKGVFAFGDLVEVQRMTVFEPKESLSVTKAKDVNELCFKKFGDWIQISKSFWNGVV